MPEFDRQVFLDIGTAGSTGKRFSGLRQRFHVEMDDTGTPNTARIEMWNPNADTIALLQSDDARVRLIVGYNAPQQIFFGSPIEGGVTSERMGPERVLKIEASDGGRELADAFVDISFETETTMEQLFAEVVDQTGLVTGTIRLDDSVRFPNGYSFNGPARELMDRLALVAQDSKLRASKWFVRDGATQFIPYGETTGETAIVFSSKTKNLIGSPIATDDGIEVVGLLAPSLRPGKPLRVVSEKYNGDYTCTSLAFDGDSGFADPFYVKAKGRVR